MNENQKQLFKELLSLKKQSDKKNVGVRLVSTIEDDNRPHFNNKSLGDIDGEVWVQVPGYETLYSASNFGRIKSMYSRKYGKPSILAGKIDSGGYIMVDLAKNGKKKYLRVHSIIAMCFKGENTQKMDVNHINCIKLDNRASNLEYITRSENLKHAWANKLNEGGSYSFGRKRYNAILTDEIVYKMRIMIRDGVKRSEIMQKLGVSNASVDNIRRGAWPHVKI